MIELSIKQIRLANMIVSVMLITTLLYAMLAFMLLSNMNPISFLKSQNFINVTLIFIFIYIAWDLVIKKQANYKQAIKKDRNRPRKQKRGSRTNPIRTNEFRSERAVSESQFFTNRENFQKYVKSVGMEIKNDKKQF